MDADINVTKADVEKVRRKWESFISLFHVLRVASQTAGPQVLLSDATAKDLSTWDLFLFLFILCPWGRAGGGGEGEIWRGGESSALGFEQFVDLFSHQDDNTGT